MSAPARTYAAPALTLCLGAVAAGINAAASGVNGPLLFAAGVASIAANALASPGGNAIHEFFSDRELQQARRDNHDMHAVLCEAGDRTASHLCAEFFPDAPESASYIVTAVDFQPCRTNGVRRFAPATVDVVRSWLQETCRAFVDGGEVPATGDAIRTVLDRGEAALGELVANFLADRHITIRRENHTAADVMADSIAFQEHVQRRLPQLLCAYILLELKPGQPHADRARWLLEQAYLQAIIARLDILTQPDWRHWDDPLRAALIAVDSSCVDKEKAMSTVEAFFALLTMKHSVTRTLLRRALARVTTNPGTLDDIEDITKPHLYQQNPPMPILPLYTSGLRRVIVRAQELVDQGRDRNILAPWFYECCLLQAILTLDQSSTTHTITDILHAFSLDNAALRADLELVVETILRVRTRESQARA